MIRWLCDWCHKKAEPGGEASGKIPKWLKPNMIGDSTGKERVDLCNDCRAILKRSIKDAYDKRMKEIKKGKSDD